MSNLYLDLLTKLAQNPQSPLKAGDDNTPSEGLFYSEKLDFLTWNYSLIDEAMLADILIKELVKRAMQVDIRIVKENYKASMLYQDMFFTGKGNTLALCLLTLLINVLNCD